MAEPLYDLDVEMTGQDANHGHSSGWASSADWIQHQVSISQLYAQHTLPEVMKIMESQYDFKATAKMYKTRIKRWGLDKKHKEKEMRAIVHKRAHRADKGKASIFLIRGKEIDYNDVVRYWERRQIPMAEVLRQRAESRTPEPVECRTPVLSPLSTPAVLAIPERIILMLRDYHKGSFESGTWRSDEGSLCCRTTKLEYFSDDIDWIDAARDNCERACDAFDNRNSYEAGLFLSVATEKIKDMVQAEHPHTFAQLFELVQCIRWKGRPEIVSAILRHFSGMSELLLGSNHPFKLVCGWLANLIMEDNSKAYQDIICESLRTVYDCFQRALGRLHHTTLETYLIYLLQAHDRGSGVVEIELERLLHECQLHLDPGDIRTMTVEVQIGYHNVTLSTPNPHQVLISGIIANSIPEVRRGIELISKSRRGFRPNKALKEAIMHCQPDIVRYLLDQAGATVERLQPRYVYYATNWKGNGEEVRDENDGEMERVERTWELLLKEGWDVNSRETRGEGRWESTDNVDCASTTIYNPAESLLCFAVPWPRLVRWCLAHGASVLDPPDLNPLWTRPLLEEAAISASLETFKLLQQHGAKLTTRVLHRAVESAAYASGDKVEERIAFVRYLIEEEGCDVNALDVEEVNQFPNHWGTPMAYAAHVSHGGEEEDGREVVMYLLEKGADPTIKDCWNQNSPLDSARKGFAGKAVVEVLEERERR